MMVSSYTDADDIIPLVETHDLHGKDCLYYIQKFDISAILNTQIFDQFFVKKFNGRCNLTSHAFSLSTPYLMIENKYELCSRFTLF